MKLLKKVILIIISFFFVIFSASAVTCLPDWDGDRTVEGDCDFPAGGYKVYGDIIVGNYTINIPAGETLGIDLMTNKITFGSGKILLGINAKIDNSVSARYDFAVPYTEGAPITNCPIGTQAMNLSRTAFAGTSPLGVAASGVMYCAKP